MSVSVLGPNLLNVRFYPQKRTLTAVVQMPAKCQMQTMWDF